MTPDLSSYNSIGSALIIRLEFADSQNFIKRLRYTDYELPLVINGETYAKVGAVTTVTETSQELRATPSDLTISLSGLDSDSLNLVLSDRAKGGMVTIQRVLFDPSTRQLLNIAGNPAGRFRGMINNLSVGEEFDRFSNSAGLSVTVVATSIISLIENKIVGRYTNPLSQKTFYPSDLSMDRVPNLVGANFNFGAPQ